MLPAIATEHDLDLIAAINLDAIADEGDGTKGASSRSARSASCLRLRTSSGSPHTVVSR